MKTKILAILVVLFTGCIDSIQLKKGEIRQIPYSSNYMLDTDSCIYIFNRQTGKTVNVIIK